MAVVKVTDDGLVAALYLPDTPGPHPAVIVLSGSGGGIVSSAIWGAPLAALGYAALALAYFAIDPLPRDLVEIPLEYFKRAIDWLQAHPAVDAARIAVMGHSRGGECALLVAATYPEIGAVVANVPSHVVWSGIHPDGLRRSAWSLDGVGLPFMSIEPPADGALWAESLAVSLKDGAAQEAAAIAVERVNGPILFLTGTDDRIWPSSTMVDCAMARLQAQRFRFENAHARYEGGGHAILVPPYFVGPIENPWASEKYHQPAWLSGPIQLGGAPEGNRLARIDAWPRTTAFLARHLQEH